MTRAPLLFCFSLLAACTTTTQKPAPIAPDEVAVATPQPTPTTYPTTQEPLPPPQQQQPPPAKKEPKVPDDPGPPMPPPPAIGDACAAGTQGCGKKGTIAVVVDRHRARRWPGPNEPCKLEQTRPQVSMVNAAFACVKEDRLIVSNVCMVCRMMDAGEALEGVVSQMTDAQLLEAQQLAGLPPSPLLSTQDMWKKSIARAVAANTKK